MATKILKNNLKSRKKNQIKSVDSKLNFVNKNKIDPRKAKRRVIIYVSIALVLFFSYFLLRNSTWTGNKQIHTLMEIFATTLAIFVGTLALIRYYTKKSNTFLIIGTAFLGTAFLDGYHAVVTSIFFDTFFPSSPASLIPWSWNASRTFLAVMMLFSYLAWRRERRLGQAGQYKAVMVYIGIGIISIASFLFFAFFPLPRAYYPELAFGRPEEFIAAFFFLLALVGYLSKKQWKHDSFEHWVVISLITGFMSLIMFMASSFKLFDMMFDVAHMLKSVTYVMMLIGLLIGMYYLFREAEEGRAVLENSLIASRENQKKAKDAFSMVQKAKEDAEQKTIEFERMNKAMIGRELKMIELKKQIENLKK